MKVVHFIVSAILVSFAVVQWNDPDPLIWILMYLAIATIPLLRGMKKLSRWLPSVMTVTLFLAFALSVPDIIAWMKDGFPSIYDEMKAESPYIESVREALGIGVCLLVSVIYLKASWKRPDPQ